MCNTFVVDLYVHRYLILFSILHPQYFPNTSPFSKIACHAFLLRLIYADPYYFFILDCRLPNAVY